MNQNQRRNQIQRHCYRKLDMKSCIHLEKVYKDESSGDLYTNPGVDEVVAEEEVSGMAANSEEQLITQESTLNEDITDYLEENSVEDMQRS